MLYTKKNTQSLSTFIKDPVNLPFIIPRPLQEESLYKAFVRSTKKKDIDLEFEGMLLSRVETYLNLLKRLEYRLCVFSQSSELQQLANKAYLFRYKGKDSFSNTLIFADQSRSKKHISSMIPFYNLRNYFLKNMNKKILLKSRMLSLSLHKQKRKSLGTKGLATSFSCSFLGKRAVLDPKNRNRRTYKFWIIQNLNLIGILRGFYIKSWTIKFASNKNISENSSKESFIVQLAEYYRQSKFIKSNVQLTKNRIL